jgi:hypothetical protein
MRPLTNIGHRNAKSLHWYLGRIGCYAEEARNVSDVLEFLSHNSQRCDFEHFLWVHKVERIGADFSRLLNDVRSILDPAFDCFFGEMSRLEYELPAIAQIDRTSDGEFCTRARRGGGVGSFAQRPSKAPKFERSS